MASKIAMVGAASQIKMPSQADLQNLTKDERLQQAAQADKAAASVLGIVDSLRSKAAILTDPKQREKMLSEAYDREVEAKGLSKKARILKSGTFQGALGGGGIGAASGMGLGTVVGTVVGTVASVPTTLLGGLIGAGTGAIHGPWIKLGLGNNEKGEEQEQVLQVPQQAIDSGAVLIDEKSGEVRVNDPEALRNAISVQAAQTKSPPAEQKKTSGESTERRKPKKLEIRSKKAIPAEESTKKATPAAESTRKAVPAEESTRKAVPAAESKPKKKPPKLGPRQTKAA